MPPRRLVALVPPLLIAGILVVVGILGFGAGNGVSKKQVDREVGALLDGIPQEGTVLGSPKAPITLWMYADLECPTVRMFVENYLPSVIETWIRPGIVKLDYRSLETDTSDEEVFFKQEMAALAASRQNKLWDFALTAVREQGEPRTPYMTDVFLRDVASQVPGLNPKRWRTDRTDALLSKRVALGVYSGHKHGLRSTPSFLIGFTPGKVTGTLDRATTRREVEASVASELKSVEKESSEDFPTLKSVGPTLIGG